ncbi:MAG: AAA family ATPase, partial [Candidatus Eremiobacteraeota bacterium]|nr:AAA family ATPase [Candidatus Eremiobacteraeota bacterium]
WLIEVRERLHRSYVEALWELARRARGRRDRPAANFFLGRILADDPWREDALRALMTVRWESGDRSSALVLCAEFEERLRDEMGVELMAETAALRQAIERGNPLPTIAIAPASAGSRPYADFPFEGRDNELRRLRELWQIAAGGAGGVAIVLGEAGMGKTRLTSEFALQVEESGGRVVWGTTSSPETAPYQAVTEIFRAALGFIESLQLEPYDLAVLTRIVPQLQRGELRIDPIEPGAIKLFDVVAHVLGEIARARPTVVVLEDLHNAGPASIAMLQHVAESCSGQPMLIVATLRAEESAGGDTLGRLLHPLHAPKPALIPLGALSPGAVRSIVGSALGSDIEALRVAALSGGHPLFLTELLRAAADPQGLRTKRLPTRLGEIINDRTARLAPDAGLLLRAAAVVGNSFDLEIVAAVLGWSEEQLVAAADELVARRVVRQTANARSFEYEFAHDLIASTVYESVSERERRQWHRRTARAAEHWYASRLTELSAFIARHFELGGEPADAAACYLRAGRAAASAFANEEALVYARRGLKLSPRTSQAEHFDLLCIAEEVLGRLGDRDAQRIALGQLGSVARRLGDSERLREVLRRRETLHRYLGETLGARRAIARLYRLALGDPRWEAIALRDDATLEANAGSQMEAYDAVTRAAERAESANDPAVLVTTLTLQAHIAASLGHREEATNCLRRAEQAARAADSPVLLMRVIYCEMTARMRFGAWQEVVQRGPRLLDLAARVGSRDITAAAHSMLGSALGSLLRVEKAREHLSKAIDLYRRCDTVGLFVAYNNLATIELEVGRHDLASAALEGIEAVLAEGESAFGRACATLIACELAAQREESQMAMELAERAMAAATARQDELFEGESLRCMGSLLRAAGRVAEALPVLERALENFKHLGLETNANRAEAELALAYALAGDARASSLVDAVLARHESHADAADSPLVLWPLAQALDALRRPAEAGMVLRRAHAAFEARKRRLRGSDRQAFIGTPINAALRRAYASLDSKNPRGGGAKSLAVPRAPRMQRAVHPQSRGHSP